MIVDTRVANRYAEAIFNIAKEREQLDALRADVQLMQGVLALPAGQSLRVFIESPTYLTREKEELIEKALGEQVSVTLINVMKMLIRRGRIGNLPFVLEHISALIDIENGLISGTVTTAVEMDEDTKNRLTAALRAKVGEGLDLQFVVKPSILGGTIVRYRDTLIDDSLKTKLKALAARLASPAIQRELVAQS